MTCSSWRQCPSVSQGRSHTRQHDTIILRVPLYNFTTARRQTANRKCEKILDDAVTIDTCDHFGCGAEVISCRQSFLTMILSFYYVPARSHKPIINHTTSTKYDISKPNNPDFCLSDLSDVESGKLLSATELSIPGKLLLIKGRIF